MPAVLLNGVRVFEAKVEVDWHTGAFVARGEIGQDAVTLSRFWGGGQACVIDGRACRATGSIDLVPGRVTICGETFPWRVEEWAA